MQETGNNTVAAGQRMVIRIGSGTLSFSVADAGERRQIIYRPYTVKSGISMAANLREAFRTDGWLARRGRCALVMIDTPALMIPAEEFSEDTCGGLYRYAVTGMDNDAVLSTVLPALNVVVAYSINRDLRLVINDNFSDVRYTHVCTPVWNHLYRRSFTGTRQKLYGYFHNKKVEVFCFQQNRFKFCNTFRANHTEDAVYFILYVWKQLGMDQRRDELHLVGGIPEREALMGSIRKYLQNAYIINPVADFNRAPITQIDGLPYDLLTLYINGK